MAGKAKASIAEVVDPMLLKGGHTRQEVMDALHAKRPDLKPSSLSAGVSHRMAALQEAGKYPCVLYPARLEAWRNFLEKPFRHRGEEWKPDLRRIWP